MSRPRVFSYVQHLLGVGHLYRAVRIAHGLRHAGFAVDLVTGGAPVAGLDLSGLNVIQLEPLRAGPGGFTNLVTLTGEPADSELKARRVSALLEALAASRPDVVLIETFPFGRRQMRFESLPLLEAAHQQRPRPYIVSSIRDILQEKKAPHRASETVDILRTYFDRVIVHGDPQLVRLDATFPLTREIRSMLAYSGIVGPPDPAPCHSARAIADVVVSAGGGGVGRKLLEAAIRAKPATSLASGRWLALAGANADPRWLTRLQEEGAAQAIAVERSVPDLTAALAGARLSISQAGYNTVADVLVAGCKAVFVPFAQAGETEQTRRAAILEEQGYGAVVSEHSLTSDALAAAVDRAVSLPRPQCALDLKGVSGTASMLLRLLADRRASSARDLS